MSRETCCNRCQAWRARAGATIYAVDGRGMAGTKRALPDVITRERPLSGTMDTGADGPELLATSTGGSWSATSTTSRVR